MMSNFLPRITEEDRRLLTSFVRAGGDESKAFRRVIEQYMDHFRDIRNIDISQNVGLQTCSHLRAYDMLEEIFGEIELCEKKMPKTKPASASYR